MTTLSELNQDTRRPDAGVWLMARTLWLLDQANQPMRAFDARKGDVIKQVEAWCRESGWRCTRIRDGKVWL